MIKSLTWVKNNWYFYLLVTLGLSYYLCIIFIRFIRKLKDDPIVLDNISFLRLSLNISITIIFFIIIIILLCMLYNAIKKNTKTSKFSQWVLKYVTKITQFYEQVLDKTLLWVVLYVPGFKFSIEKLLPYFNQFIRTNHQLKFIIIIIVIYCTPIIVTSCFLIDAYNNQYYYFSRIVIILILPLIINSILYVFKTTAFRIAEIWRSDFYVESDGEKITKFQIISGSDFSQELETYKTIEEKRGRMHSEFHFYQDLHQINYKFSLYQQFQFTYKIPIMLCKLIIVTFLFMAWTIISYTSIMIY